MNERIHCVYKKYISVTYSFGSLVVAMLLIIGFIATLRFGSIVNALLYLNGQSLVLTPSNVSTKSIISRHGDRVAIFTVRNLTSQTIEIVGARAGCSCLVTASLPCRVEAMQTTTIPVFVRDSQSQAVDVSSEIVFLTDVSHQRELRAEITSSSQKR